mmetsp:Transcript_28647/g.91376  ORF Transcript_28647/g.91376 Transcript_28647/m.91376 type:complete len:327 (-) Transcript_28647:907-1887(-)
MGWGWGECVGCINKSKSASTPLYMITLCFSGVHELVQPRLLGGAGEESAHVLQPVAAQLLLVAAVNNDSPHGGGHGGAAPFEKLRVCGRGARARLHLRHLHCQELLDQVQPLHLRADVREGVHDLHLRTLRGALVGLDSIRPRRLQLHLAHRQHGRRFEAARREPRRRGRPLAALLGSIEARAGEEPLGGEVKVLESGHAHDDRLIPLRGLREGAVHHQLLVAPARGLVHEPVQEEQLLVALVVPVRNENLPPLLGRPPPLVAKQVHLVVGPTDPPGHARHRPPAGRAPLVVRHVQSRHQGRHVRAVVDRRARPRVRVGHWDANGA